MDIIDGELTNNRLEELIERHAKWSQKTFGSDDEKGPEGAARHLTDEAYRELNNNPYDVEEQADVFLLLLDVVRRSGGNFSDLLHAAIKKQNKNDSKRRWMYNDEKGHYEHDRNLD